MSEPAPAQPAKPAEPKKKARPTGVEVEQRTVIVGDKLEPMEEKHQTRVPWKE